jgi:hypothetical protein
MARRNGQSVAEAVGGGLPISFSQPQSGKWTAYGLSPPSGLHSCSEPVVQTPEGPTMSCRTGSPILSSGNSGGPWIDGQGAVGAVNSQTRCIRIKEYFGLFEHEECNLPPLKGALLSAKAERDYQEASSRSP